MKNKIIKKITAAILVAACLFSVCSCGEKTETETEKYNLNGRGLSNYSVVISERADICDEYTAELLCRELEEKFQVELKVTNDGEKEKECEILVGKTNREESSPDFSENQYAVYSVGTKTVLKGYSYAIACGISKVVEAIESSSAVSEDITVEEYKPKQTKSVILLIGDGMGENHIKLAENSSAVIAKSEGNTLPQEKTGIDFAARAFQNKGTVTTLNIDGTITDSAASATALATGNKTKNAVLGMIPADLDGDGVKGEMCTVQNVREAFSLAGKSTAVLSTDRETGATPNAFLVHHADRYESGVILEQQAALKTSELSAKMIWCNYDSNEFSEQLRKAIETCEGEKGFFIMAEEAMIDKYASRLDYDNVIRTVKRLNETVLYAATYGAYKGDVAVIVTADHETGGLLIEGNVFFWTSDGQHTDTAVPVFAMGEGTEMFSGKTADNTDIGKFIISIATK